MTDAPPGANLDPDMPPAPNLAPALPAPYLGNARGGMEAPGYWHYVSRAFYRPIWTKAAVAFAALVVCVAIFVPFLANAEPYRIEIKDAKTGAFHPAYPLFDHLSTIDLSVLLAAAGVVVFYGVHRRIRRRERAVRQRVRRRAACILGALTLGGIVALSFLHSDFHGYADYRQMLASGAARNASFAPIPWGYADAEPLESNRVDQGPSARHPLGTDGNGQDALARLLWSCRVVLGIGLTAESISVILGILYGAFMGFFSGTVDILGMRVVEMIEAIPILFLLLIFVAIFGRKIWIITLILGLTGWTGLARFVRAEYLRIRQLDFIAAATAGGIRLPSILFRHILPNALSPILVVISFGVAGAITSESILSFLGVGLEPPTPSWGTMLNEAGNPAEIFRPWLAMPPGMMIFLTIFACNIIGEALRDALDPKLNRLL